MARPDLGTKRLCPNCGAKYYDLNRDPIICPKCNASFVTGMIAATAREVEDDDDELETDEGIELVPLEDADETDSDETTELPDDDGDEVPVESDDDALIDDDDDDDEVSDVVRGTDDGDEDER